MRRRSITIICAVTCLAFGAATVTAMERPTAEQIEHYRADGTLADRAAAARATGNHLVSPHLVRRLDVDKEVKVELVADPKRLPSLGRQRVFALLIGFSDYPGLNPKAEIHRRLFNEGPIHERPYESLRDYYLRSSYGLLELTGSTLGWYRTAYPQSSVQQTTDGREALIREAIDHFDAQGHDFSRYDNDGDGAIDYFLVFYAGPHQEWGDFWWGYQQTYQDSSTTVDGLRLGAYSWQWESWEVGGTFAAGVAIHETGHALGLPDYYDYDDEIGPPGGLGGLDMMDSGWGDHNAFSKFLLGWVDPLVVNEGLQSILLNPSSESRDAVILMHGDPVDDPFCEYFIAQVRKREGNDADYPSNGLLIWHIDARTDGDGRFLFDNSYTEHKLIRLMEADGLEEIEQFFGAGAGDFWVPGDVFSTVTTPSSLRYDGSPTNLSVDHIERVGFAVRFDADLGSGCGIFAEVADPMRGWPRISIPLGAAVTFANCDGTAPFEWRFSDGSTGTGTVAGPAFVAEGNYSWELESTLGDASLSRRGELMICSDLRCYQWRPEAAMEGRRLQHSAVVLADGRVLVVGGGPPPEVFDPTTGQWSAATPSNGVFGFASAQLLDDGRVLVTGSTPGDSVNAEVYDPMSDQWTIAGRMNVDRVMHSSVRLADGRVLVAGGYIGDADAVQSEIWDPATGSWTLAGGTGIEEVPGLVLLDNGEVFLVGSRHTRIFNPARGEWRRMPDLWFEHRFGATVRLVDDRVMVIGGEGARETEIFDPILDLWRAGPSLNGIRAVPSAAVLPGGHVVVTGGADGLWRVGSRVEVFDPDNESWTEARSMADSRLAHTISVLHDGALFVTGGTISVLEEPYRGQLTAERFLSPAQAKPARKPSGRVTP